MHILHQKYDRKAERNTYTGLTARIKFPVESKSRDAVDGRRMAMNCGLQQLGVR